MTTLIEAREISHAYAGHMVVDKVSLAILKGQIVTLVGPNGCGKSTLLKILLGLVSPNSGSVWRKENLKIGYMPQKMQLDAVLPMTVEWFLKLYAKGQGYHDSVAETGVSHLLGKPLQALSGGELQRVMLARALLSNPELLVLDEPVQGVDVNGQAELYGLITRLKGKRGLSVLMVSHDLHFVMSSTDQVICLNRHICCAGHPHAVQGDPAFAALFGRNVADSLALYTHHHDHHHA